MTGRAGGLYGGIQFTTAKPFANQEVSASSSSTPLKPVPVENPPPEQRPTRDAQPSASGQTPVDLGSASTKASAGIASPEQKDVIQSELNHVSPNLKDGLLLLRLPQYDAMLSRNRNRPRPRYQVLFLRGHCHQHRRSLLPPWSLPHPPLPKYLRIRPRTSQFPNQRDGERRSNLPR